MAGFSEKDLTAFCGLYCGDCIRFQSKAASLASELLKALDEEGYKAYAASKTGGDPAQIKGVAAFSCYEKSLDLLEALAEGQCNTPCRLGGDGCSDHCPVKECCQERGVAGCWECTDFEKCPKADFLQPVSGTHPKENVRIIKEKGLDGWSALRCKFYRWQ